MKRRLFGSDDCVRESGAALLFQLPLNQVLLRLQGTKLFSDYKVPSYSQTTRYRVLLRLQGTGSFSDYKVRYQVLLRLQGTKSFSHFKVQVPSYPQTTRPLNLLRPTRYQILL